MSGEGLTVQVAQCREATGCCLICVTFCMVLFRYAMTACRHDSLVCTASSASDCSTPEALMCWFLQQAELQRACFGSTHS